MENCRLSPFQLNLLPPQEVRVNQAGQQKLGQVGKESTSLKRNCPVRHQNLR
jgi:hypothetical protein